MALSNRFEWSAGAGPAGVVQTEAAHGWSRGAASLVPSVAAAAGCGSTPGRGAAPCMACSRAYCCCSAACFLRSSASRRCSAAASVGRCELTLSLLLELDEAASLPRLSSLRASVEESGAAPGAETARPSGAGRLHVGRGRAGPREEVRGGGGGGGAGTGAS